MSVNRRVFAGITLLTASSMRFRFNEHNPKRAAFFSQLCFTHKIPVAAELRHSHTVFTADTDGVSDRDSGFQFAAMYGDGIITRSACVLPVITAADCMPIFIYEPHTSCIGVLHSGWKGTGIVLKAFEKAAQSYGAAAADFRIILGPHIGECCYTVDKERARFFAKEFSPECVAPAEGYTCAGNGTAGDKTADGTVKSGLYRLSLEKANRALLKKAGVQENHIVSAGECTCCTKTSAGAYKYGSFRRETAAFCNDPGADMQRHFTPMAAFIGFEDDCFTPEKLSGTDACIFSFDCGKIGV